MLQTNINVLDEKLCQAFIKSMLGMIYTIYYSKIREYMNK